IAIPRALRAHNSTISGINAAHLDIDGKLYIMESRNLDNTETNTPRADAVNGLWQRGDGRVHFTAVPPAQSGFLAPLDVTGLALIKTPTGNAVLVANNGDSLSAFAIQHPRR